jgi:hypothetical protein
MNQTEQLAVRLYPELKRLIALKQSGGWVFQPTIVDGELELLTGYRVWLVGGWSDAIAISERTSAKSYRCNADGGVVWKREDTLACVLDELIKLPRPDARSAPQLVIGARHLWVPGMPL